MTAYYNEWEPYPAQWLRNLIKAGLIASGDVDERSIKDVKAEDLKGYAQCHFFAGIGGWSFALRLAGWPDDEPVWTGSCPCQPFSCAGKGNAREDERHLWPEWCRLIKERNPTTIFGEQVDNAIAHGWTDEVLSDLEKENYACGSAVLPAFSVQANHERKRIFFVADSIRGGQSRSGTKLHQERPEGFIPSLSSPFLEWLPIEKHLAESVLHAGDDGLSQNNKSIHAAGNAIVPQVAAGFIRAFMECMP